MTVETYEEQFGPVMRRVRRVWRWFRWRVKGARGRPRAIVVEIRWRLGDEIMAIPIYSALREAFPGDRITVLCSYPGLLEGHPAVDAVNPEAVDPDRYILLRSGPRSVVRIEHYARCAGVATPVTRPRLHYSDWTPPEAVSSAEGGPLVAVSAGASWPTKRWPVARWRTLCQALMEMGCRVVELGTADDEAIGVGVSLVGQTSVREAACALGACRVLVCCDSGLMHLALASGTPAIALFGPTEPSILVRNDRMLAPVQAERDCTGCWNRLDNPGDAGTCPHHREACLDSISVEIVLERVRQELARAEPVGSPLEA